jgi:hypothetical protein
MAMLDIRLGKVSQEETLAAAGLPKHRNVRRPADLAKGHRPLRSLSLDNQIPEGRSALVTLLLAAMTPAVPDGSQEFFEDMKHNVWIVGGVVTLMVTTPCLQNQKFLMMTSL